MIKIEKGDHLAKKMMEYQINLLVMNKKADIIFKIKNIFIK